MTAGNLSLVHRVAPARSGEAPHPGLLLLHGRGADEADLLPLAAELDPNLYAVSARAPFRFPWGGYAWYGMDERSVGFPEEQTLQTSVNLLDRFLGEITEAYPIDPRRLYVGGFSMGAVMSGTMALLKPERVAGAIMLSGYLPVHSNLPFKLEEVAGHPFFEGHGTLDSVIPVTFGRQTRDYLLSTPVDLTYREYPIGHEIGPAELLDLQNWLERVLQSASVEGASH